MKKTLLISGVLLALTATVASAAGINLSWTDCGANGQQNRTFACAVTTGNNTLCASFDPPAGLTKVSGINTIMDLQTLSAIGPTSWWDISNPGSCRSATPSANTVFGTAACNDYFAGLGGGGIAAYITTGTNRRRLAGSWSQNEANLGTIPSGQETYALNIVINNSNTTTCNAGCSEPACIVFNDLLISQPVGEPLGSPDIGNALTRNWVTWQGGDIGGNGCPAATPTVNKTWGQVKSIYR